MLGKDYKIKIVKKILIVIGALYFIFLYMDIFKIQALISSDTIKFISIILIFIISLLLREYALDSKRIVLLQIGLFITIFADLFLLLLNRNYILGVALFSIVQILNSIRYDLTKARKTFKNFIIMFLILLLVYFSVEVDFLFLIVIYYIICLLISTIRGIGVYIYGLYPSPNKEIIALGMIFFLLCDINVGLYNIIGYLNSIGKCTNLSSTIFPIWIWLFYLPSQILLSLSEYRFK